MTVFASPRPAHGFAVRRSDLASRADVNYFRMQPVVDDLLGRFRYPIAPLGEMTGEVQYGSSSRAVEEDVGMPVLRMGNLQDGDWDLSGLKYTTLEPAAAEKYRLEKGDILFNRTNSKELVGKCATFREDGDWIFVSYLIRVRVDDPEALSPDFLARFLNSDVGRVQIDRFSRQIIGMANINKDEIKALMVPTPPPDVQEALIGDLNTHWQARQEKLTQVRMLLARGDEEIASRLGLHPPERVSPRAWAVRHGVLSKSGRINAEFFHPERIQAVRAILDGDHPARRVDTVADFVKEQQKGIGAQDVYIGLANVERDSGELVPAVDEDDLPTGQVVRFQSGDVLFGKLRPYLNKVYLADHDGVCSPEFFVLRPRKGVRGEYLAAILRAQLTLAQTRHMAGGNTHPRLTPADVHAMVIPVPENDSIQNNLADVEAENRAEARRLKAEAESDWSAAKQRFGDDLVA